jgi:hypothetical protein
MLGSQNQVTRLFGLEGDDGESESSHEIWESESSHEIGGESESSHEIVWFQIEGEDSDEDIVDESDQALAALFCQPVCEYCCQAIFSINLIATKVREDSHPESQSPVF